MAHLPPTFQISCSGESLTQCIFEKLYKTSNWCESVKGKDLACQYFFPRRLLANQRVWWLAHTFTRLLFDLLSLDSRSLSWLSMCLPDTDPAMGRSRLSIQYCLLRKWVVPSCKGPGMRLCMRPAANEDLNLWRRDSGQISSTALLRKKLTSTFPGSKQTKVSRVSSPQICDSLSLYCTLSVRCLYNFTVVG